MKQSAQDKCGGKRKSWTWTKEETEQFWQMTKGPVHTWSRVSDWGDHKWTSWPHLFTRGTYMCLTPSIYIYKPSTYITCCIIELLRAGKHKPANLFSGNTCKSQLHFIKLLEPSPLFLFVNAAAETTCLLVSLIKNIDCILHHLPEALFIVFVQNVCFYFSIFKAYS